MVRRRGPEKERDGQQAGLGRVRPGAGGWGAERQERPGLRGKDTSEPGTEGSKSDRRIKTKRSWRLRGVGKHQAVLRASTEREREAGRQPSPTEGPHWGRCGEAAASCQEWGSRTLTALLPQEHQLEFPQRIPEVSARGHDGAGGAAAASAQRPLGLTLLQPVDEIGERKDRRRALSDPLGPGCGARLQGRTPPHRLAAVAAASPQSRLAPSEARGWERMAVSEAARGVLEVPNASAVPFSAPGTETGVREAEGGGTGAADATGTSHAQRLSSHSSRRRSPTCRVREPGRERAAPPAAGVRACVRVRATSQRLPGLACSPGSSRAAETSAG